MHRQLNAMARPSIGGVMYQISTKSFGMTMHRYQDCENVTVESDAQDISVRDLGEVPDAPVFCTSSDW